MRGLKRRKAAAAGEDGWSSTQMSWRRRVSIKRFGWRTVLALPYGHVLHRWMNKEKYLHLTSLWLCIGESNRLNTENYTTFQGRHQSLSSINVKWGESFFIVLIRLFFFQLKLPYANNQDRQSKIYLNVFFSSFPFCLCFNALLWKRCEAITPPELHTKSLYTKQRPGLRKGDYFSLVRSTTCFLESCIPNGHS